MTTKSNTRNVKGKPLNKEETKVLLELVEGSSIINNKTTNAISNKLKIEEWKRIKNTFNATVAMYPRTSQQLRLKWENLKKNARKRNAKIRMKQMRTGGGPPDFVPPDEILDKVTTLLDTPETSFAVPFEGNRSGSSINEGKKKMAVKESCIKRNEAISLYYSTKTRKLNLEIEKLQIEIKQLKEKGQQ